MTMQETEQVGAALSLNHGLDLIGGIAAVCAVIPGLQGAAAFAAGVYLAGEFVAGYADS